MALNCTLVEQKQAVTGISGDQLVFVCRVMLTSGLSSLNSAVGAFGVISLSGMLLRVGHQQLINAVLGETRAGP